MNFTVLPPAQLEAAEAAFWYEDQRSGLGSVFLAELQNALDRIRRSSEEFPPL